MFDPDGNAPDIFENRIRHEQAVKMEISRLRKMGFTNFQTDVRLSINLGEGKSAIRVADIAAMKPGQSLSEAEFHEVKTVKKAEKLTAKNAAGTIFKKFLKVSDMFNVVEKIGRGASVINQMKKDIALDELGATVQRTGEPTTDGAQMKWSIYEHDSKGIH